MSVDEIIREVSPHARGTIPHSSLSSMSQLVVILLSVHRLLDCATNSSPCRLHSFCPRQGQD